MGSRLATDEELALWHTRGWVVLEELVGSDEIDEAVPDLWDIYPTPEDYHADTDGGRDRLRPGPAAKGAHPVIEQFVGMRQVPFPGQALNRLCVHPSILDVMERLLGTPDIRLYQAQTWAKYTGDADYDQPMHCDRNHALVPLPMRGTYSHVEGFLFLSDVEEGCGPTHVADLEHSAGRNVEGRYTREEDPELYRHEQAAVGPRGSMLVYRSDVFHRGTQMTRPGGSRFLFNISYRPRANDLVEFQVLHPRAGSAEFAAFLSSLDQRQLAAVGFPMPGHPVWDAELVEATARRYPEMDLAPWRAALPAAAVV